MIKYICPRWILCLFERRSFLMVYVVNRFADDVDDMIFTGTSVIPSDR